MLNNLNEINEEFNDNLIEDIDAEKDWITLERTDELPIRFRGQQMHKYKSRAENEYVLYEVDESHNDAIYVVSIEAESYAETKHEVHLFQDSEVCRLFFIDELGTFESLQFQVFLGDEDVEYLE